MGKLSCSSKDVEPQKILFIFCLCENLNAGHRVPKYILLTMLKKYPILQFRKKVASDVRDGQTDIHNESIKVYGTTEP